MKSLATIAEIKIRTAFVGALAEFESVFGALWGAGLSDDQLTDEQRMRKDLWIQVRSSVLDKGNAQLRALLSEIALWDVSPKDYRLNLVCKGKPNG